MTDINDHDGFIERAVDYLLQQEAAYIDDPYQIDKVSSIEYYATSACNMSCSYCYLGQLPNKISAADKSAAGAMAEITRLFEAGRIAHKLEFLIIGGEPLLSFKSVSRLIEHIENLCTLEGIELHLKITTNGTLINNESAEFFLNHNFEVYVSHDGSLQSSNRPGKSQSVYTDLEGILEFLGPDNVFIRSTLMTSQLGNQARVFSDLSAQGFKHIAIGAHYGKDVSEMDIRLNVSGIVELDRVARGTRAVETNLAKAYDAVVKRRLARSHCSAGMGHIVLDSAGTKHACATLYNVRDDSRANLITYDVDDDPVCGHCSFRYVCQSTGGGCRAWRVLNRQTGPDDLECSSSATRFALALKQISPT